MRRTFPTAVFLVVGVAGTIFSLQFVLPYISPFLIALLLAALIDAPVNRLVSWGVPRSLAVLTMLAFLTLCMLGALFLLVLHLLQDLIRLSEQLPGISQTLQDITSQLIYWVGSVTAGLPQPVADALRGSTGRVTLWLEMLVRDFLTALAALPSLFTNLTVAAFATFFLSRDGRRIAHSLSMHLPPAWQARMLRLNREIFAGVVGFVRAQALLMSLSGILSTIVFSAFGAQYAWLLGVLAGILDMLPMVGLSAVFVPVIVWHWLAGHTAVALGISAAWGVVLVVRQVCEPAIVGANVGLHPLTSLAAMYIGVQAWGLTGVFLGPLVATSTKVLWVGALRPMLFHAP